MIELFTMKHVKKHVPYAHQGPETAVHMWTCEQDAHALAPVASDGNTAYAADAHDATR